jgi:hypothetical protein
MRIGPGTHRGPPVRTDASVPDIATPSNSTVPLPIWITPPPQRPCARVQRAARSATAPPADPIEHATRNVRRIPCDVDHAKSD